MSARVTQNPLKMPDIRLHAIPNSHNFRSGFLLLGGDHIRRVRGVEYVHSDQPQEEQSSKSRKGEMDDADDQMWSFRRNVAT